MPSTRARTWAVRTALRRPGKSWLSVALPAWTVTTSTSGGGMPAPGPPGPPAAPGFCSPQAARAKGTRLARRARRNGEGRRVLVMSISISAQETVDDLFDLVDVVGEIGFEIDEAAQAVVIDQHADQHLRGKAGIVAAQAAGVHRLAEEIGEGGSCLFG